METERDDLTQAQVIEQANRLRDMFRDFARAEGNEPLRCSRVPFDDWQRVIGRLLFLIGMQEREIWRMLDWYEDDQDDEDAE